MKDVIEVYFKLLGDVKYFEPFRFCKFNMIYSSWGKFFKFEIDSICLLSSHHAGVGMIKTIGYKPSKVVFSFRHFSEFMPIYLAS